MANLLGTLHSASSGMSASQAAIQTTSHNINNLNTPGFSRQRVDQTASRPFSQPGLSSSYLGAGQLGTGVEVNNISRIRNTFYDFQFRNESHIYGDISVKYDYYKNMENIFNEPSDNAISSSLNKFFNGWHEVSKDPNNVGAKNIVIENAKFLANNISQSYSKLEKLKENIDKQTSDMVNDINSMLSSLKDLDTNIKAIEGNGKTPNDLLDARDKILDELSFKININDEAVKNALSDGSVTIDELKKIDVSGELSGALKMGKELDSYMKELKDLSKGIADSVNDIYNDGLEAGDTKDLFIFDDKSKPILKINEEFLKDSNKLKMTTEKSLKLFNLKNEKINVNGQDISINNYYNSIIEKLGHATQTIVREEKNQSQLMKSIDNSRLSVSGVSLDEEMISLIQFQHAYNASAKVVSTIDSLLDVVINGLVR
ncbi:flagellar hook-associated protein FlgK [Clostridium cadaveris]|uniref:Flagellar hook-associated protein 1 n=1 Tax=Clostridium cadaveris TaxID=1529 RepID=A0A316M286_9CLOT|nr:flagellar hook-associated protein FlgK [Clostridium cadaveris]NWK12580.1 flagellar hook-associated protein FlgK [Clostridium cadaveris]PWL52526.1 MAG: flagellar hook-associated protein FlgK [Clostridium cadaveris]